MTLELCHEGLAETHDFCIALALGIKVRAALAAADGERCKAVFKCLLEAEELHNAEVYIGLEAETALVRPDSAVELYAETTVYMRLTIVVYPCYTELDRPFRLDHALQKGHVLILGMAINNDLEGRKNFFNRLKEFGFISVALLYLFQHFLNISVHEIPPKKIISFFSFS